MVDTFYLHLEFTGRKGEWAINLPFLCNKCGVCCTLEDFLTAGEIKDVPQKRPDVRLRMKSLFEMLGCIWKDSKEKYDQYVTHNPCPFLNEKSCSIYEIRPEGCRLYPKTEFGMQTQDCDSLNRFKKQRVAVRKGRAAKETYLFTNTSIKSAKFTEKQYQTCLRRLCQAGITDDELALFNLLNKRKNS